MEKEDCWFLRKKPSQYTEIELIKTHSDRENLFRDTLNQLNGAKHKTCIKSFLILLNLPDTNLKKITNRTTELFTMQEELTEEHEQLIQALKGILTIAEFHAFLTYINKELEKSESKEV